MVVIPSGLQASGFLDLKLYFPKNTWDFSTCPLESDGGDFLQTIRRLAFDSDLYLESIDSYHLFFGSDDPDLLRPIQRLRFNLALQLSGLWEFQLSTENPRSDFYGVHDPSPSIPLDLMVEIYFSYLALRALGVSILNWELSKWYFPIVSD